MYAISAVLSPMFHLALPTAVFQATGAAGLSFFLPLIFMFAIFYLLLIRPQQTKQKKWQEVLGTLKSGDRVTTAGGLRGVIIAVKDDSFHLRIPPDNLRVEVVKTSVVSASTGEEGKNEKAS